MALDLTALRDEIARDREVNASAATLINNLADEIERSKADPEALQALVDELRSNSDSLASAVSENTPQQPEQPEQPPVAENPGDNPGAAEERQRRGRTPGSTLPTE